jgi:hypothetical protein
MKILSATILSAFYLLFSVGLMVNTHYCSGEVESVALMSDGGTCCCGDEEKPDDCCSDETNWYKLDSKQFVNPGKTFEISGGSAVAAASSHSAALYIFTDKRNEFPPNRAEQLQSSPPLWLMHCSLTYYG